MKKFKLDKINSKRFIAGAAAVTMFMGGVAVGNVYALKDKKNSNESTIESNQLIENRDNKMNINGKKYEFDSNSGVYVESDSIQKYEVDPFGNFLTKETYESIFVFDPSVNKYLHFYDYDKYYLDENGNLFIKDSKETKIQKNSFSDEIINNWSPIIFNNYSDYEKWASNNFTGYIPFKGIMVDEETYYKINSEVGEFKETLFDNYGYGPRK